MSTHANQLFEPKHDIHRTPLTLLHMQQVTYGRYGTLFSGVANLESNASNVGTISGTNCMLASRTHVINIVHSSDMDVPLPPLSFTEAVNASLPLNRHVHIRCKQPPLTPIPPLLLRLISHLSDSSSPTPSSATSLRQQRVLQCGT